MHYYTKRRVFLWHPAHPTTPQAFDGPISSDKGTYVRLPLYFGCFSLPL